MKTRTEAIADWAHLINVSRDAREQRGATGGPAAVAKAAHVPGGPSQEEIAAIYTRMRDEAAAARTA
jgi:hypothetical protein